MASTCVESKGETLVLDPLAPPSGASSVWERLDAHPPTAVVALKPDHIRDVAFVHRYQARAFVPRLFFRNDIPETVGADRAWHPVMGRGIVALEGRGRNETPLWLAEQRALVFADALTAPGGELRVWASPWHEERALPALRALLELPFEHVIVSHGEPVHTRATYWRALELTPWEGITQRIPARCLRLAGCPRYAPRFSVRTREPNRFTQTSFQCLSGSFPGR